jgi:hypothetical protein
VREGRIYKIIVLGHNFLAQNTVFQHMISSDDWLWGICPDLLDIEPVLRDQMQTGYPVISALPDPPAQC